ncbi:MAG TPA: RHS repeat-associated core domain-containing protein [Pyrinomonadaceae bacterium]|nr:RHS repeat-associated core domain-containing protein [Pyrinomonadaceae bacterium]
MPKKNKPLSKSGDRRSIFLKITSVFLIISMLVVSTPAAPAVTPGLISGWYQDLRFSFSHSLLAAVLTPGAGRAVIKNEAPKLDNISEIQIFPGSVTLVQGQQMAFSAVGYDAKKQPLSGIKFSWTSKDTEHDLAVRQMVDSVFKAKSPGTFMVTAEYNGISGSVTVTVTPSKAPPREKAHLSELPQRKISSRDQVSAAGKGGPAPESVPGEWGDGNYPSSDDPGNLPGDPPGHPVDDGAGNGNFSFSAPLTSLPGRGIDVSLNMTYNSRLWNKSAVGGAGTHEMTYDIDHGFPAPGWSLGFGKMVDLGASNGSMLIDADGTRHAFSGQVNFGGSTAYFSGQTADGTFIDYSSVRSATNGIIEAYAWMSNGTFISYGALGSGAVYPVFITDPNGNNMMVTYKNNQGPEIETITDTMGRVITFNYDSLGRLISIQAPRMLNQGSQYGQGTTRTVAMFHYRELTLGYSFANGYIPVVRDSTPWALDSIYYPANQTGYWFGGADPNGSDYSGYYSSYGMLTKFTRQRGMSWQTGSETQGVINSGQMSKQSEYNYPLTTANQSPRTDGVNLTDAPKYTTMSENYDGMDNGPAVTTYNIQQNSTPRVTTVTRPNGTVSKQYSYNHAGFFEDGLVYQDETYVPDVNNNLQLVAKSIVSWQEGAYHTPRPTQTDSYDELNLKTTTTYDYTGGNFNQALKSCEYDNAGVKLRCTLTEYENGTPYIGGLINGIYYAGRHVFNLVKATGTENPDGSKASWTAYEYDNYQANPLVNTPGVIYHDPRFDPYTTLLQDGECTNWVPYECGAPPYDPITCYYCDQWEQISVFDPGTNARGNITKVTTYSNAAALTGASEETRTYDITGNLRTESTSCCQLTSYDYSTANQYAYPESSTRGAGDPNAAANRIMTSTVYSYQTGLTLQETDANGNQSTLKYHPDALRATIKYAATGSTTFFSYNDTAMTVTEETLDVSSASTGKTIKYVNGADMIKREDTLAPNSAWDIVETKYTRMGEVWKKSRPYRTGDTVQWSETTYDGQGRVTQVSEPDGSTAKVFYNESARPDSASSLPGNTVRMVDPWGRERWARYDQAGKMVEVVEPNPNGNGTVSNSGSLATKYTYNTLGKVTEIEQGVQHRYFKYDSLLRLTHQKHAEQTATLNDAGAYVGSASSNAHWSEAYTYDNRSNVTQKTDARGVRANYVYTNSLGAPDPLNRLQVVWYDISGPLEPNLTVHGAPGVTYEYVTTGDKMRILKVRTDGLLTEDFAYDGYGRLSDLSETVDYRTNYPMVFSYLYDSLNRVTDLRYPAQYGLTGNPRRLVHHTYDIAGRVSGMAVDGQQRASDLTYNANDDLTSIKVGTTGTNQITESYTYDAQNGYLTNQKVQRNSQTLLDLSYDYNRNNSVGSVNGKTGLMTKVINNLDNNKNREYEFDALGRLTKAKGGNNLSQQQYVYDRYGNRTSVTATGVAADNSPIPRDGHDSLVYDQTNNHVVDARVAYDVAGNQSKGLPGAAKGIIYEYDAANRLAAVKKKDGSNWEAFQYGPTNARIMSYNYDINQLTIFANNGGLQMAEYTEFTAQTPTWTKSYNFLGENLFSTWTPNGQGGEVIEYDHPDKLGTRLMTNQATGSSFEQANLPFGNALNAESSGSISRRFTSYERSPQTGLDYAINRTYDALQGRFTQVDPIGARASDLQIPQTLNLYSYCGNDPVNHTDPDGLFFGKFFKWLGNVFKAIMKAVLKVIIKVVTSIQSGIMQVLRVIGQIPIIGPILQTILTLAYLAFLMVTGQWVQLGLTLLQMFLQTFIDGIIGVVTESIKSEVAKHGFFVGFFRGLAKGFKYLGQALLGRGINVIIPIYGFFCGPGYGTDGPSANEDPIDDLDAACKAHDLEMARIKREISDPKERARARLKADLLFIKRVLFSHGNNPRAVMYRPFAIFTFLWLRILPGALRSL